MASLALRGDTWHIYWRWNGQLKSQSTKVKHDGRFKNKKPVPPTAAKRELERLKQTLDKGRNYETKTLSELLDAVENEYAINGYDSLASLKSRLKHLRKGFGNLRADRIQDEDLEKYAANRQKEEAANATIHRELEMVLKALRKGKITPLPTIPDLKLAKPREGFFNDEQMAQLTAKLPEHLRGPFLFGYYTGWRKGDVLAMEWSNIDFTKGEVRTWIKKTEQWRVFPMDAIPALRLLLTRQDQLRQEWQKAGNCIVPWVFPQFERGIATPRRIVDFKRSLKSACIAAGYPGKLFHDLRRSAARNLEAAGWPRSMVMAWCGWETEEMFKRYCIRSAADIQVVKQRMRQLAT